MKPIILLFTALCACVYSQAQMPASFTSLQQKQVTLQSLQGKKMLLVLLPQQNDTALTQQLLRFQNKYKDSIQVVAFVKYGNPEDSTTRFRARYADLMQAGVLVTTGSNQSGASIREGLCKWITDSNNRREEEGALTGYKFFLSKNGRMYAQFGADISLDMELVQQTARIPVPGDND